MNKAVGMANISGRCFKNGANKLATTQICSLSIKPSRSPNNSKLAKFKPLEYLADSKILYRHQSGFCKNHSTDTFILYLTNKMLTGFDCFRFEKGI